MFFISVAPFDEYPDYTLNNELTDEQMDEMIEALTEEYYEPSVELRETDYGTTVVVIDENEAESDYADLLTIWHGYFVGVSLLKQDEITPADLDMGMKLMSNLWVVDAAPAAPAASMAGGWTIAEDSNLTAEQLDIFYLAAGDDTELQPMALLGTQLVAGTNYAVLCQDPEGWKIAYIYAALDGNAELVRTQTLLETHDDLAGGWVHVTGESLTVEQEQKIASAFEGMLGASYEVDLVLAEQVVAGTNYAVLARKTLVTAEPVTGWVLATVYVDLEGNASVTDVQDITLSLYE